MSVHTFLKKIHLRENEKCQHNLPQSYCHRTPRERIVFDLELNLQLPQEASSLQVHLAEHQNASIPQQKIVHRHKFPLDASTHSDDRGVESKINFCRLLEIRDLQKASRSRGIVAEVRKNLERLAGLLIPKHALQPKKEEK